MCGVLCLPEKLMKQFCKLFKSDVSVMLKNEAKFSNLNSKYRFQIGKEKGLIKNFVSF